MDVCQVPRCQKLRTTKSRILASHCARVGRVKFDGVINRHSPIFLIYRLGATEDMEVYTVTDMYV